VRKVLEYDNDARQVLADPAATYSGVKVSEKTLVPGTGARLGSPTFRRRKKSDRLQMKAKHPRACRCR
jgi:hypothetical protein